QQVRQAAGPGAVAPQRHLLGLGRARQEIVARPDALGGGAHRVERVEHLEDYLLFHALATLVRRARGRARGPQVVDLRPPREQRNLQPDRGRIAVSLLGASGLRKKYVPDPVPLTTSDGNACPRATATRDWAAWAVARAAMRSGRARTARSINASRLSVMPSGGVVSGGSSTSYGTLAGRPIERASAPRAVCRVPSTVSSGSWAWERAVFACSTSAMVARPTRCRCSAASRLVCASFTVVCWAASSALVAWYWK